MEGTEQRLQAIFKGVFELQGNSDVTACERSNTAAWDSMGHVMLVVAIEQEFGVSIEASDSLGLTSYDSARQYLAALGV